MAMRIKPNPLNKLSLYDKILFLLYWKRLYKNELASYSKIRLRSNSLMQETALSFSDIARLLGRVPPIIAKPIQRLINDGMILKHVGKGYAIFEIAPKGIDYLNMYYTDIGNIDFNILK